LGSPKWVKDSRKLRQSSYVILFSINLTQSVVEIYRFSRLRFQIEFIFFDAKQFTGLCDCQAQSVKNSTSISTSVSRRSILPGWIVIGSN